MYVNYFDHKEKLPEENQTIGILLCTQKHDAVVKMTLPIGQTQILATEYKLRLPTEEQLMTLTNQIRTDYEARHHSSED
ncbi:MAG: DUF1016 family protein [Victivallales bacterium]|nr:DUF1016 family protein [Victivallales bacterium]